jgi:ABC-2 type transport system permease protein
MVVRSLLKLRRRPAATFRGRRERPAQGRSTPIRLVLHQFRYDLRSFQRNKQARFTTLVLPLVLLVAFVSIGGGNKTVVQDGHTITTAVFYVPGLIALAVVSASFANLLVDLVGQRESGILKRRRATPVPPAALIAGRALTAAVISLATALVLLVAGANIYDISVPSRALPAAALTVVLGSAAFACFAYAVAPTIRSSGAIQPVIQLILFPLYAMSGVFLPDSKNPAWLRDIASVLPLQHLAHSLHHAFDPHSGLGLSGTDLAVLGAWALAALAIAIRRFSWLPTRTATT